MALSDRERAFCEHYVGAANFSGKDAAEMAGYKESDAYNRAHRILNKPEAQIYLATLKAERSERMKIDADWLLAILAEEATADIADIYNDGGFLKPIQEWPMVWRRGLVAGIDVEELFEGRGPDRVQTGFVRKVKLADRTRIKEMIGKHVDVQAWRERHEHTGKDGGPIQVRTAPDLSQLTTDELRQMEQLLGKCEAGDAASSDRGS